jgi:hypothetical protein
MSAVVNLYGLTGKPIVIQNPSLNTGEDRTGSAEQWVLDFEKNETLAVWDFLTNEQPAQEGAYSFFSYYLQKHTIVSGEKDTFVKTYENADGTVGNKIHTHVMNVLSTKVEGV